MRITIRSGIIRLLSGYLSGYQAIDSDAGILSALRIFLLSSPFEVLPRLPLVAICIIVGIMKHETFTIQPNLPKADDVWRDR